MKKENNVKNQNVLKTKKERKKERISKMEKKRRWKRE